MTMTQRVVAFFCAFAIQATAVAADMPGFKLVKEIDGWLFGTPGLLVAGILFGFVALFAFTPWTQRVQPWHALLLLFGLVLFFGSPSYMPIVKTWI